MQTLGLSDSTLRSESRLKSLFWPSIQSANDVDYLGAQGYWVCAIVSVISLIASLITGHAMIGILVFLVFYLGGVGVRERSRYAAAAVLALYSADMFITGPNVVRVLLAALLLSNLRATWLAARWEPESQEAAMPPRFGDTWSERFVDQWPTWLWPRVRYVFYVLSAGLIALDALGIAVFLRRRG